MESKELFLETLRMKQKERIPLFPRDLTLGMDSAGVATDAVFGRSYDSKLSAECVLSLQGYLGSDATVGCISCYSLEAVGGMMKFPANGIPYTSGYPFENPEKIDSFEPSDVIGDTVKGMRKSCEIVKKKRPDLALVTNIAGPVTMSGFARGLETLMMDMIENEGLASKVVNFCTDAMTDQMKFMTDGISDAVFLASASDNPDMVGNDGYTEYSLRNVRKMKDAIRSEELPVIFHPHGIFSTDDRRSLLNRTLDIGMDGFQFSEGNEPEGILEGCRGRCAILGGVDAYSTLYLGPEKRIVRDTDRFLRVFENSEYILTCSCSLNRGQPLDNLKVMADRVHAYNRGMK